MQPITAMPPIRVWKIGDCDWVAARTKTDAIDCYLETSGMSRKEVLDEGVEALTAERLKRLTFITDEVEDESGSHKRHSFAVDLKRLIDAGATFPRFFASTEF